MEDTNQAGIPATTPEGGSMPVPAGDTGLNPAGQGASSSPFYSYKFDDGEESKFASKEELDTFFRGGVLRHRDYT